MRMNKIITNVPQPLMGCGAHFQLEPEPATRAWLEAVQKSDRTRRQCERVRALTRQGRPQEAAQAKRGLSFLTPHAYFPSGERHNELAHPSGCLFLDLDHLPEARSVWQRIYADALELDLLFAEVSPSGCGLHLIFPIPPELRAYSIGGVARAFDHILGIRHDEHCEDLARCMFVGDTPLYIAPTFLRPEGADAETADGDKEININPLNRSES